MSDLATLSADELLDYDGDARVADNRLGELLGYARPRNVRQIIKAHISELLTYGALPQIVIDPSEVSPQVVAKLGNAAPQVGAPPSAYAKGGRPEEVYLLNEAQAILVTMFSRTKLASQARQQIVEVFIAWRRGHLQSKNGKPATVAEFMRVGQALKVETNRLLRLALTDRLNQITDIWGIARVAGPIGYDEPDYSELLGEFWSAIAALNEEGISTNLSLRNDLIAMNMPILRAHFAEIGMAIDIDRQMMKALRASKTPRYIATKPVRCKDKKVRDCWVFSVLPQLPLNETQ